MLSGIHGICISVTGQQTMLEDTHSNKQAYKLTFLFVTLYYLVAHGRIHTVVPFLAKFPCAMIAGVLAVCSFWFESLKQHINYYMIREEKLVLGLIIMCVITLPTSVWPSNSFFSLGKNFLPTVILMFITGIICRTVIDIRRFIWVYIANCAAIIFVALSNELNHFAKDVSDTYDVNDIALVLCCSLPIVFQLMLQSRGIKKLFLCAFLIVTVVTIIKTGSRGGVIGLVTFAAYFLFNSNKKTLHSIIVLVAFALVIAMAPESAKERFSTMINPQTEYDKNLGDRTQVWERGLKQFLKSPILGAGFSNFAEADGRGKEAGDAWRTAHNSLLQVLVELGIVGLILFIKLIAGTIIKLRRLRKRLESMGHSSDLLGFMYSIETSLLVYFATAMFLSQAYNRQLYFIIAIAIASQKLLLNDKKVAEHCFVDFPEWPHTNSVPNITFEQRKV